MTLNKLGEWFNQTFDAIIQWLVTGSNNLYGDGDFGELTIGQVVFAVFISIIAIFLLQIWLRLVLEISKGVANSGKDYSADEDPWNQ
jgi:hypothetical protein